MFRLYNSKTKKKKGCLLYICMPLHFDKHSRQHERYDDTKKAWPNDRPVYEFLAWLKDIWRAKYSKQD